MLLFTHLAWFFLSLAGVWLCSGALIQVTELLSRRTHRGNFFLAFVLLGILTSFSEIAVAFNATRQSVPEVSVGNLLGASLILFLWVTPILAVIGNGIKLQKGLSIKRLLPAALNIMAPIGLAIDGKLTRWEGAFCLLIYVVVVLLLKQQDEQGRKETKPIPKKILGIAFLKVLIAAALIALSGRILVQETLFFSEYFSIPASMFGLLVLSIATNIPELAIGIRSAIKEKKAIALGDYIGSASANTAILGVVLLANGTVLINTDEWIGTAIATVGGIALFLWFLASKKQLSRREGLILLGAYAVFVAWELYTRL